MYYLYFITGSALFISFLVNRAKTFTALNLAVKKFIKIIPAFLIMIILISLILFFIPDTLIIKFMAKYNKFLAVFLAAAFGSITIMPGFIAFPLCGLLLKQGVMYMILSVFSTTLMMVGIITYPVEKTYFGHKVTIIRNILSLGIALVIALVTGLSFGEIF